MVYFVTVPIFSSHSVNMHGLIVSNFLKEYHRTSKIIRGYFRLKVFKLIQRMSFKDELKDEITNRALVPNVNGIG